MTNQCDCGSRWEARLRCEECQTFAVEELTQFVIRGMTHFLKRRSCYRLHPEDIAQDTVIKVFASLEGFRGQCRFFTWVMVIANRIAISELRRRRVQEQSLDALTTTMRIEIEPSTRAAIHLDQLDAQYVHQRLHQLIENVLSEKQRCALNASLIGMPIEETAALLNSNRNAVYKLMHDARVRLREALTREGIHFAPLAFSAA